MNKTPMIITWVILGLIVVAGLYYYFTQNNNQNYNNPNPASTSQTTTDNTTQTTVTQKQPGLPTASTNTNVSPSDTTAVVSGQVIPNGAFTNYWYEYGTTASLGKKTSNQLAGSGFSPLPAPGYITGLTKDTTYYFRLVVQNQFGTNTGSQASFRTTVGTPAPVGNAPTTKTLAATGVSRTAANLSGQVNPNKAPTQYWFEYGTTANLGNTSSLASVGDGSVLVPAGTSLSNLDPATTYYFRLNAQNQFGTTNGSILTFKTSGPAPSSLAVVTTQVASPVGTTTATLRGTVNPYGGQTTYWFEYSTDSTFGTASLKSTPQKTSAAITTTLSIETNISGLISGTTYYYRVVAQNSAGVVRGDNLSFKTK